MPTPQHVQAQAQAQARPPIRLLAQVLTCLVLCLLAALIIHFSGAAWGALFTQPVAPTYQLLVGQGLALVAAAVSYGLFRMTEKSASSARAIQAYARLDLSGLNPLWISIAAAVGEELLFRAALQPLLGIWITSLVFLLTHVPVYRFRQFDRATLVQALSVFVTSVVLGVVFERVGLIAAMLVHLWIDVVGLMLVRAALRERA